MDTLNNMSRDPHGDAGWSVENESTAGALPLAGNPQTQTQVARADAITQTDASLIAPLINASAARRVLSFQGLLHPDANGLMILPSGAALDDISIAGDDLIITLAGGEFMIIPNGASEIPDIQVGDIIVPADTIAQLLNEQAKINPEAQAQPSSSGGNFAEPEGVLGDPYALGDLLPPTALAFGQERNEEILPQEVMPPTIVFVTSAQPLGTRDATSEVNEAGLPARGDEPPGSDSQANSETSTGSIMYSAPSGTEAILLNDIAITVIGQTIVTPQGILTITDIAPGAIRYSYTLTDNSLTPVIADVFNAVITTDNGDTATATLTLNAIDDVPIARDDDGGRLDESAGNTETIIDVFANDTSGADGVELTTGVSLVTGPAKGSVVYNGDGTFTYTLTSGAEGSDSFVYRIIDGDGDTATATVTIELAPDDEPSVIAASDVIVDEDGLVGANADDGQPGEVVSTNSATGTGSVRIEFGNDVPVALAGSLVLNDLSSLDGQVMTTAGEAVTFALQGGDLVGSAGGEDVLRISLTSAAAVTGTTQVTYGYEVTLSQSVRHPVAASEDSIMLSGVGFTVTDSDGSQVSGSFDVTLVDDIPTLTVSDTAIEVMAGEPAVAGTWVLDAGADGVTSLAVSFGASSGTLALPGGGDVVLDAQADTLGTLTVRADGSFSFLPPSPGSSLPTQTSFTLSGVDGDGDPVTQTVTIALAPDDEPSVIAASDVIVDEDGLVGANADDGQPGEVVSTNSATGTGSVRIEFGNDVPVALAGSLVLNDLSSLDGQVMTTAGEAVTFALQGGDLVGSAGGEDVLRISLTSAAAVTGTTQVTYGYEVTLSQSVRHPVAANEDSIMLSALALQ